MIKKFDSDNAVLSFHIYMWNRWSPNEAAIVFNTPDEEWAYSAAENIWNKWDDYCDQVGSIAAPSMLVCNLDTDNLNKLIDRACELYDGRRHR